MKQIWPIIAVADVARSSAWYGELLGGQETHPGATVFNQIVDSGGMPLICLHHWGPSGARGDKHWPNLSERGAGAVGHGLLLWFVVDDFDAAWERALAMGAAIEERPNTDNGTGQPAFVLRDADGYVLVVNQAMG